MSDLKRRIAALESSDSGGLREYPADDRTHDEKLAALRECHGPGARFLLPRGIGFDALVDLFT